MKLFITVGTQLPFDRLIKLVDGWLAKHSHVQAFAQIGPTTYRPAHMQFAPFIGVADCQRHVQESSLVIAHAGMGSILTALEIGKPIVVMPRKAVFGEHRNDHQIATARSLLAQGRVIVAFDDAHLLEKLDNLERIAMSASISRHASPQLLNAIRSFVVGDIRPTGNAVGGSGPHSAAIDQPAQAETPSAAEPLNVDPIAAAVPKVRNRTRAVLRSLEKAPAAPHRRLKKLSGIVLLDGAVRRATFANAIGRSLLELPVDNEHRLLDIWRQQIIELGDALDFDHLPCRVVVSQNAQPPQLHPGDAHAGLSIERDPVDLRGTGGILRDLAADYDDDAMLLVANAAQLVVRPLLQAATSLAEPDSEVSVASSADGVPISLALISCGALKRLPAVGFVDLKEQGLPLLARKHEVSVVRQRAPLGVSVRTASDYIAALHQLHEASAGRLASGPFQERWGSSFSIVEEGASVAPGATLHNSVVLAGGCVEARALVARSIVCAGNRVSTGGRVVDRLLAGVRTESLVEAFG